MSRPTKLTQQITDQICLLIRAGNYVETAASFAGVSKDTLYRWLRDGQRAKAGMKRLFSDAVGKAVAEAEVRDVEVVRKAAEKQWQAAAWRLERKYPDRWGRRDTVKQEVSGPDGEPVKTEAVIKIPGGEGRVHHAYREKIRRELEAERAKGAA